MKKKFLAIALSSIMFFVLVVPQASALVATDLDKELTKTQLQTTFGTSQTLPQIVGNVIKWVLGFLGLALLVIFIYAGFLYMTAGGDPEKTKKAKAWMKNAVIGLIIIILAYAISSYVVTTIINASSGAAM